MICTMLWERRLIVWPVVLDVNAISMAPECLVIVVQIIDEYFQNVFVEHGLDRSTNIAASGECTWCESHDCIQSNGGRNVGSASLTAVGSF